MALNLGFSTLLLAAQASGIALNLYQGINAGKLSTKASELEQQQLDLRMEQETLAASEQSLYNTRRLSETLASQRALLSLRGTNPAQGSAAFFSQSALREFGADERARRLNLSTVHSNILSKKATSKMLNLGTKSQIGTNLLLKGLEQVSFNELLKNISGTGKLNKPVGILNG